MKKIHRRVIICCLLFIGVAAGITVLLFPYFEKLAEPQTQEAIQQWVHKMGAAGLLAVLGIQIVQVVIAFIPGEPVEVLSGALYGTAGGLVICLAGCIIASTLIFVLSKRFGKPILYALFGKDTVEKWKWLQDCKQCTAAAFILFFIPGTPKDMLTYIVGVTDMSLGKFIAISTFARIPSIVSSTMIGSAVRQGDWMISFAVFLITGTVGIVGISFKDKIITSCRRYMAGKRASMQQDNIES